MRAAGITGYQRRRRVRTTVPDQANARRSDLLKRGLTAPAPTHLRQTNPNHYAGNRRVNQPLCPTTRDKARPWPSSPPRTPTESTPTCKTLTQKTRQALIDGSLLDADAMEAIRPRSLTPTSSCGSSASATPTRAPSSSKAARSHSRPRDDGGGPGSSRSTTVVRAAVTRTVGTIVTMGSRQLWSRPQVPPTGWMMSSPPLPPCRGRRSWKDLPCPSAPTSSPCR